MLSNFKNLSLLKKIGIIVIPIILITLIVLLFTLKKDVKQEEISIERPHIEEEEVLIPDVDESNTKITLSSTDEVESVTVSVEEQLKNYNLCYYIKTNADLESESQSNQEEGSDIPENSYMGYESPIVIEENSKIFFSYEKGGKYSEKEFVVNINNIVKKLQETEEVSEEVLKKEQVSEKKVVTGSAAYYIRVNYGANVVTIYGKDDQGNYTKPVKAMICSCGRATPTGGVYKTSRGYDWGLLVGGVYGQYSTRIVGSILFHSVPYTARAKNSLEYWEFDKLGTKASAGCVRLMVSDAKWIFNNCGSGVMVEFYSSADPGPLGKPSAPKISGNERCRNWDPTDYVSGNPWLEKEPVQQQSTQPEIKPVEQPESNTTSQETTSNSTPVVNNVIVENTTTTNNTITNNTKPNNTAVENKIVNNTISNNTTSNTNTTTTNSTTSNNTNNIN